MSGPRLTLIVLCSMLMLGCASRQPGAPVMAALPDMSNSSRFGTRPDIHTPEQLHQLTPEQQADFLNLDAARYLALYYSNVASDAILAGDYGTAWWHLQEALRQLPDHGPALNMLAVVYRRVGDLATAEAIYRYGIAHAQDKLSLLKNYHTLLRGSGREAEAARIQLQLDTLDDPSPFHWLQLARESQDAGDWGGAIRYYQRVLVMVPYMHEAHLGLAQSYYGAGRLRSAERSLRVAAGLANKTSTRTLYEAKLASLRQEF